MTRSVSLTPLARRRRGPGTPALYAGLIVLAFFTLIPFYWMVATALKEPQNVLTFPPQWVPIPAKFSNFVTAWTVRPFGRWFANSIFIAAAATFLQLVTCSMAAYAFARLKFAGRDRLFLLYLGTLMIPGQVTLIPTFILIRLLDWSDTYQALILPPAFSAFGTFLLRQFFLTIPFELEDAARIDGANRFQTYFRVILPLAGPGVAALTIFSFLQLWNSFLWPLVITNTIEMNTITVGLRAFQGQYMTDYSLLMAAATLSLLPMLIVFLVAQRYFVEGIQFAGITGR
ncbi:MAG: carbohydrate ABC transporter permease [Chloroflexota bacterium]|nr:MAG: carbohydrate ABC transporter permease [Chloroflexota bacterium]